MTHIRKKHVPTAPPPLVPRSPGAWLMPFGKLLVAILVLPGRTLAYAIGRQAQLLSGAADRH